MSCAAVCKPKLTMPYPCCRHCRHPYHPLIASGHPSPCWRCEIESLAAAMPELAVFTDQQLPDHPQQD
jgi:hypothetical protein